MMPLDSENVEKACVLIVDDDPHVVRTLSRLLNMSFTVLKTSDPEEAISLVRDNLVHVVVSDQRMPKMTGVELLKKISLLSPLTTRILLTGYSDLEAVVTSINESEIYRYINKPWSNKSLTSDVSMAAQLSIELRQEESDLYEVDEEVDEAPKPIPKPIDEPSESFDELFKFFDETFIDDNESPKAPAGLPAHGDDTIPLESSKHSEPVDKSPVYFSEAAAQVSPIQVSPIPVSKTKKTPPNEKVIIWQEDISVDCVNVIQEYIAQSTRFPYQPITFDDRKKMERYLDDGDNSSTVMVACLSKFHDDKTYHFLERLKRKYPYLVTIVLTPEAYLEQAVAIINNCRAYRYLASPTSFSQFKLSFGSALKYQKRVTKSYVLRNFDNVGPVENKYSLPYFEVLSKWFSSTFAR